VEVDILVNRGSKPLNQRDGTGARRLMGEPGFLDQVRGDNAIDDTQHLAHDRRANALNQAI
jgi:type I restriction enzyme S subunit